MVEHVVEIRADLQPLALAKPEEFVNTKVHTPSARPNKKAVWPLQDCREVRARWRNLKATAKRIDRRPISIRITSDLGR